MSRTRPEGTITRGTTNPNRLRRNDRWLASTQAWRLRRDSGASGERPVVVDLGYGATPVTTVELHDRLRRVSPTVEVIGIEIDPARVAAGQAVQRALGRSGLSFRRGGFEIPTDGGVPVTVVRAFNVLRQYDESAIASAWARMASRLTPDGIVVDGTCDELGRISTWVTIDRTGPVSLTSSLRLRDLPTPGALAPRLPKALIHRNVPGERMYDYLRAWDTAWTYAAPLAAYGVRHRFLESVRSLDADGWPILGGPSRWRLGEVTVAWEAVAP
ncbi:MAG: class I SAM-dependent methyltransferase [Actinomycetales bacterium]|nr:class I SAM-dependent methyltransferase [Actinomycetales bacterium]